VRLRSLYDADEIATLNDALLRARGNRLAGTVDKSLTRDKFLSRRSSEVSAFVRDPRLAAMAAERLGCRRIRFMQDVMLEKDGEQVQTPWHRDSDFWSFSGIGAITMWIPLQDTSLAMSPLRYASRSHLERDPRPIRAIQKACILLRFRVTSSALALGDVAVHHFKTLHGAARNSDTRPRRCLAVHLIDADARVRAPRYPAQVEHPVVCGWDRLQDGDRFTDDIAPLV
jgi:ectoine hydroxylase-related dioxygenase (phytanoyl-CoA dioxygenase family)